MKNIIYLLSISILIISCETKPIEIKDEIFHNPDKFKTHLHTLEKKDKAPFKGFSIYKLTSKIDLDEYIKENKGKTYKVVIEDLVSKRNEFNTEQKKLKEKREKSEAKNSLTKLKSQLKKEIESTKKVFDGSGYRGSIDAIQIELAVFGLWSEIVKKAEKSNDKDIKKLGKTLKNQVSKIQIKEFPKLRKDYGEVAKKLMWENNIKVKAIGGSKYTTLEFEGGAFANNKNIKEVQTSVSELLNMLRFKRVNYKWYEYDDNYTYYDLKPKKDGDV